MTKSELMSVFLEPGESLGEHKAAAINRMAVYFDVTKAAIYQWPDERVPKLRELQSERYAAEKAVRIALASAHPTPPVIVMGGQGASASSSGQ